MPVWPQKTNSHSYNNDNVYYTKNLKQIHTCAVYWKVQAIDWPGLAWLEWLFWLNERLGSEPQAFLQFYFYFAINKFEFSSIWLSSYILTLLVLFTPSGCTKQTNCLLMASPPLPHSALEHGTWSHTPRLHRNWSLCCRWSSQFAVVFRFRFHLVKIVTKVAADFVIWWRLIMIVWTFWLILFKLPFRQYVLAHSQSLYLTLAIQAY